VERSQVGAGLTRLRPSFDWLPRGVNCNNHDQELVKLQQKRLQLKAFELSVSLVAVAAICASCDSGVSGPDETAPPILGSCNVEPNYVSQVRLNRWREFPLRYDIIETTFPEENRDDILARVMDGINQWAVSTNDRIGSLVRIRDGDDVDLIIVAEDLADGSARTIHAGGSPFLFGGRIIFDRQTVAMLSRIDGQILSAVAAHEMGHLLGIIGHPAMEDVLMHAPHQAPQPTTTDLNTMSHAYCR
jgi:hypothetical protein